MLKSNLSVFKWTHLQHPFCLYNVLRVIKICKKTLTKLTFLLETLYNLKSAKITFVLRLAF